MSKPYLTKLKSLIAPKIGLVRQGNLSHNLGRLAIVVLVVILVSTNSAHAGFIEISFDVLTSIAAFIVNVSLSIASWFVALTGMLLNVSIILTMNIKGFVDSTPAIFTVWKAIRDITGLFIIFTLLYASIRMIIGQNAKLGDTLKNIIIAGVLINFSFFITAFLIDASNIVSLQLYKAITPGQPDVSQSIRNSDSGSGLSAIVTQSFNDGGLSAVFMQALRVQTIFNSKNLDMQNNSASNAVMVPFRIIFIGLTGIIIMITVGLSFLFAALAFIVRMVLLLMLLAFSPIWCAAYVIPSKEIKAYGTEYWSVLVAQLTFMPAYLLLMYVAMKIISESSLFNTGGYGNLWQGATGSLPTGTPTEFISFVINASLIIIMLNLPLLAAIKLGASTGGLLDGNKLGALAVWKKVGSWSGKAAYQNTISRGASAISRSEGFKEIASRSLIGALALKGVRGAASDYDKKLDKQIKSRTEFAESLGYDQAQVNTEQINIRTARADLAAGRINQATADARISAAKQQITTIKNQRKFAYADRINTRSPETLLMKRARKDKVAAAKIHIDVWESQLKDHKEDLKDIANQIKAVQNQINAMPGAVATVPQTNTLNALLARQANKQNTIDNLEIQIGDAKLVK